MPVEVRLGRAAHNAGKVKDRVDIRQMIKDFDHVTRERPNAGVLGEGATRSGEVHKHQFVDLAELPSPEGEALREEARREE